MKEIEKTQGTKIDVENIGKKVGLRSMILKDISFTVCPGELIGILGPSGSGKSTLLKSLNGYIKADTGKIYINGIEFYSNFNKFRSLIGYVPQDDIIHKTLSVYKALYYTALLRLPPHTDKKYIHERLEQILKVLELEDRKKTKINKLSGGQRKRVSIGVELITKPPLLFLDEPTAGLDPSLECKMMRLFRTLANEGRTVLLSTHIMESVGYLDLIVILVRGRMAYFGPPDYALTYFQVPRFLEIYEKLEEHDGEEWSKSYLNSNLYKKLIKDRSQQ
ncbi:MAG: ABC transporter ATP-binding/permease protein [bacterium ADurb.Bin363]|nr:MAG: ABC transporter ATP-binding/permease protein [bacterium ADurb.Bin363]